MISKVGIFLGPWKSNLVFFCLYGTMHYREEIILSNLDVFFLCGECAIDLHNPKPLNLYIQVCEGNLTKWLT